MYLWDFDFNYLFRFIRVHPQTHHNIFNLQNDQVFILRDKIVNFKRI